MKVLLLASILLFGEAQCSGHMQIRLKSEYSQDLTVLVAQGANPTLIALPIRLPGKEEKTLGTFPMNFSQNYTLRILGGKVKELGINGSTYIADFEPIRGTASPKQLYLPLRGLQLVFECDDSWTGAKCDVQSGGSSSQSLPNALLDIATDYSVDLEALPKIVDRLKETTKVENEIRNPSDPIDSLKRRNNEDQIVSKEKTEPVKPKKVSPLLDLFKTILSIQDDVGRQIDSDGPIVITFGDSEEEEAPPPRPSFVDAFRRRMEEKREKEAEKRREGIERHREAQQMLGMRHTTPRGLDISPFAALGPMMALLNQ